MKLILESTAKVVEMSTGGHPIRARIWEGETPSGIKVHAYITLVAVPEGADQGEFERELRAVGHPREASADVEAIPNRLIL